MIITKPILSGVGIILRPLGPREADLMFRSQDCGESMRLTGSRGRFDHAAVLAHCTRVQAADDRVDYAIVPGQDPEGEAVGEVVLNDIDTHNRSANFRIALFESKNFGKGYGSEATRLILGHGFGTLDLHRIELSVFAFNPRAIHVYEGVGFKREGIQRDALLWDGAFIDAVSMAMLKPEWLARNAPTPQKSPSTPGLPLDIQRNSRSPLAKDGSAPS